MSESAFPIVCEHGQRLENSPGMTLRDYFAAKAMEGMLSSYDCSSLRWANVAADAYNVADAMLKARSA
jgi:hypothetical protein